MEEDKTHDHAVQAMHQACRNGDTDVVFALLIDNADLAKTQTVDGDTPLMTAARSGQLNVARILLSHGARVDEGNKDGLTPLCCAAAHGFVDVVALLLEKNARVDSADADGMTPLLHAAQNGHVELVSALLKNDANVDTRNFSGMTPLLLAAQNGHVDVVSVLLENEADVDLVDSDGATPLSAAAQNGHAEVVSALLEKRANVNSRNLFGITPLLLAAQNGHVDVVSVLLDNEADVDMVDADGAAPLSAAARNGHGDVVRELVMKNAAVDMADREGATALHCAAESGHADVAVILLQENADLNLENSDGATPLFVAAENGHAVVVAILIARNADVDATDFNGVTPHQIAVRNGHVVVVAVFLESNVKVKMTDAEQVKLFCIAAREGHVDVVASLLKNNAQVEMADANGMTPLLFAARNGHVDVVAALLEKTTSVDMVNSEGASALHIAAENGHAEVATALLKKKAKVDMANTHGATPLFVAASKGHAEVACVLLQHHANVHISNRTGLTPLHVASQNGHVDVVALLLEFGAQVEMTTADGVTALLLAAKNGHEEVISLLSDRSANIEASDAKGVTPLSIATHNGHMDAVIALLEINAKVDMPNDDGETPLYIASRCGHAHLVDLFLSNGVQPDVSDAKGNTPLIAACRDGHLQVVSTLLKSNASLSAMNAAGETPLLAAASSGNFHIVETLIQAGASPHVRAANGDTLLICAARWGNLDTVTLLVEGGCVDPDCTPDTQVSLVAASLHTLREYGQETHEFQALWGGVVNRLAEMYAQFQKDEDLWRAVMQQYIMIIYRFVRLKTLCATSSVYSRLVASRNIANQLHDVHTEITFLQRSIKLTTVDSMHTDWVSRFESDQISLLEEFQKAIDDDIRLKSSLQDEAAQVEAISLLQHEVSAHGDKCSPEMLQLLMYALDKMLQVSTVNADSVPAWFIPLHKLDVAHEGSIASAKMRRAVRAQWSNSIVMVSEFRMAQDSFIEDVNRWVSLSHPNVVKLFGASHLRPPYIAVFENVTHTNLREYLFADGDRHLLWQKLYEAALGLKYLHERGVVLDVLQCEHIWIGTDGSAKINGFGIGASPEASPSGLQGVRWQSPECIRGAKPSVASNVYSLGMCIYEAMTGKIPWIDESDDVVASKVASGYRLDIPERISKNHKSLLMKMWYGHPSKRMSLAKVIQHLKNFAEKKSDLKDAAKWGKSEDISGSKSFDLEGHVFKEFASTMCDYLDKLEWKCRNCVDSHDSVIHIFDRLRDVYALLKRKHMLPHDFVVANYCQLLLRLHRFLRISVSEYSVLQRAKSQRVWLQNDLFHRDIDDILELLSVSNIDPIHNWKGQAAVRDTDIETLQGGVARVQHEGIQHPESTREMKIDRFDTETLNQNFKRLDLDAIDTDSQRKTKYPSWFIPFHEIRYNCWDPIGVGAFGEVYKATWLGTSVVVKFMGYESDGDEYNRDMFLHELRVWFPLNHPHVIRLFGACHIGKRYFACEYAENGTLGEFLKRDDNSDTTWHKLYQAALGLQYLHEQNIVHNDLRCDNILICGDGEAKITDFGMSCIPNSAEVKVDAKQMGAVQWKSPEYLRGERLTVASDIYSFGMCILEAVSGEPPWGGMQDAVVRYHVGRGRLPQRLESMSDNEWTLIEMMCASTPSHRIKISLVVEKLYEISQQQERKKVT